MADIYKGALVRVTAAFTSAGASVDPSAVALQVKDPAGTTTTPSPTKDSTGNYHSDVNANLVGDWVFRWSGTGSFQAAAEGEFVVKATSF